jgi:hypothetical protein
MLFRRPISERTVADNLRRWKTGGLRRLSLERPLPDAIPSGRTPEREAAISDHPCLKPQHFMRIVVRALLPLGEGVLVDPFMGSGATIAAAEAVGYESVGVEIEEHYFALAERAVPRLAALYPTFQGDDTVLEADYTQVLTNPDQLALALAERPPGSAPDVRRYPQAPSPSSSYDRQKRVLPAQASRPAGQRPGK